MEQVAILRATNCAGLQPLGDGIVAACGPKTAYLVDTAAAAGDTAELGTCVAPREATTYTLWLPPGATAATAAAETLLIYGAKAPTASDEAGYEVCLLRQPSGSGSGAGVVVVRLSLPAAPAGPLESLQLVMPTVLAVQTATAVALYTLDPTAVLAPAATAGPVEAPRLGEWAFPAGVSTDRDETAVRVVAAPWPAGREVVVALLAGGRAHACVFAVSPGTAVATVEHRTPREGLALPTGLPFALSADGLLAAQVWWPQRQLVLLFGGADSDTGAVVVGLPLTNAAGGAELGAWSRRPHAEPEFVTAATRPLLAKASDLCCTAGGAVWAVDASTGPGVVLRNVASPFLTEAAVPSSSTAAKVSVAVCGQRVYVQAGRGVYAMPAGEEEAAAESPATATATATATAPVARKKNTLCDWLLTQQQQPAASKPTPTPTTTATAKAQAEALADQLLKGGHPALHDGIVRDALLVGREPWRHHFMAAVAARDSGERVDGAVLRYAALAQSLHPLSVLLLLNHAAATGAEGKANDALLVAVTAFLCEKPALRSRGGFQRMAEMAAAADYFFSRALEGSAVRQKRYAAALCRAAVSALATGALDAADLLFSVADVAVAAIYGRNRAREVGQAPSATTTSGDASTSNSRAEAAEGLRLEADIADGVSVLSSYADWALGSASTALGMMTAHLGEPSSSRKEAALRDGKAHPIRISRAFDIAPLQLQPRATASLPAK